MKFSIGDKVVFNKNNIELLRGRTGVIVKLYPLAKSSAVLFDEPITINGVYYENFTLGRRNSKLDLDPEYKKIKKLKEQEYTLEMLKIDPFKEEIWSF